MRGQCCIQLRYLDYLRLLGERGNELSLSNFNPRFEIFQTLNRYFILYITLQHFYYFFVSVNH